MADVVIVFTILAVIAVCVGYVEWCDRIIRRDESATPGDSSSQQPVERDLVEVAS